MREAAKFIKLKDTFAYVAIALILVQLLMFAAYSIVAPTFVSASSPFFNGFESDTTEWNDFAGGVITRVPSGTDGITSSAGAFHAETTGPVFTRWGGYESVFPTNGYVTSLDVYLDMSLADGSSDLRFDFSSAINNPSGSHRRDFIIHLGTNPTIAGQWAVSASNNAPGWPLNPLRSPADINETGWYTIQHTFRDVAGVLEVTVELIKVSDSSVVGSWVLSDPTDIIGSTVGGNRYGWFTSQQFDFTKLAIDNSALDELAPLPSTEVDVYQSGDAGWSFNPDPRTATFYEMTADEASLDNGSLYAGPITNSNYNGVAPSDNWDKFIAILPSGDDVNDVQSFSYDFLIGSGGDAGDDAQFYLNVYTNLPGSSSYYDCRFDYVPTLGSTSSFTSFVNTANTTATVAAGAGCSGATSWSEMPSGSTISFFAINMGDTSATDQDLDGYFDNVSVKTATEVTVYDFEPDTTKPTAIFITPNGEAYRNSVPVEFYIEDSQTGINNVVVNVYNDSNTLLETCGNENAGGATSYTLNCTVDVSSYPDGNYVLKGGGFDTAGNNRTISTTFIVDRTRPVAEFVNPNGEAYRDSVPVEFEISDVNGINNVVVNVYDDSNTLLETCGNENASGASDYTLNCTVDVTSYPEGDYVLKGGGFDTAGNNRTISTTFIVDKTRPDANFINPNGETYGNSVDVEFKIDDVNGLNQVVVNIYDDSNNLLDTCQLADAAGATTYTIICTIDSTIYPEGNYVLKGGGFDTAGNNRTITTTFTLDKTAPTAVYSTITTEDTTPTVSGSVDDPDATVEIKIGELVPPYTVTADISGNWTFTVGVPLGAGSYDVTVTSTDEFGNSQSQIFADGLIIEAPAVLGASTTTGTGNNSNQVPLKNVAIGSSSDSNEVASSTGSGGTGGEPFVALAQSTSTSNNGEEAEADEESDEGAEVLQSTTDIDNSEEGTVDEATEDGCFKIFGICWYWYGIPVLVLILGYGYYISQKEEQN